MSWRPVMNDWLGFEGVGKLVGISLAMWALRGAPAGSWAGVAPRAWAPPPPPAEPRSLLLLRACCPLWLPWTALWRWRRPGLGGADPQTRTLQPSQRVFVGFAPLVALLGSPPFTLFAYAGPRRLGLCMAQARQTAAAVAGRRRRCAARRRRGGQPVCGAAAVDVRGRWRPRGRQRGGRRRAGQAVLPKVSWAGSVGGNDQRGLYRSSRAGCMPAASSALRAQPRCSRPLCTHAASNLVPCPSVCRTCRCQARLGSFNWAGTQSSSGAWVTPAFQVRPSLQLLPACGPCCSGTLIQISMLI